MTPGLDALRAEAGRAEHAITGTMLAHMPVPEAKAVVALKAAIQNLLAALVAAPQQVQHRCQDGSTQPFSLAGCGVCGDGSTDPNDSGYRSNHALVAAPVVPAWQPIETAPKSTWDLRDCIGGYLHQAHGWIFGKVMYRQPTRVDGGYWYCQGFVPTHWMRIAAPSLHPTEDQ